MTVEFVKRPVFYILEPTNTNKPMKSAKVLCDSLTLTGEVKAPMAWADLHKMIHDTVDNLETILEY